jgi:hypothetical protein
MRVVAAVIGLLTCVGCLPTDTRPPPAEVTVTTSSSALTLSDIPDSTTADGYAIHFERVFASIGQVDLGGGDGSSACNEYSNPDYTRLFDFKQVNGPHELGLAFATGHCPFGFSLRFPNDTTLLDVGVTDYDALAMRIPGSDALAMDAGVSVFVEGTGTLGNVTKHFAWPFRKRIGYDNCGIPDGMNDGGGQWTLALANSQKLSVNLEIHAEALFQNVDAPLAHFAPYAQADANGDGQIDFAELWTVPIADVIAAGFDPPPPPLATTPPTKPPQPNTPGFPPDPALFCYDENGDAVTIKTLGDYAYCELLPGLARYESTGACSVMTGRANHG